MNESYLLFTQAHWRYVQGVRRAFADRLRAAYGAEWWRRGVLEALDEPPRRNLERAAAHLPDGELPELLDVGHFAPVTLRNHAAVFAGAFPQVDAAVARFRRLAALRNRWAHLRGPEWDESLALPALSLMNEVLIPLRCPEALEIVEMIQASNSQADSSPENLPLELSPMDSAPDESGGPESGGPESDEPESDEPESDGIEIPPSVRMWQEFQSYLAMDYTLEPHDERPDELVKAHFRVANLAPSGDGRPQITFRAVHLYLKSGEGDKRYDLGALEPGQSAEKQDTLRRRALPGFQVRVEGDIDINRLYRIGSAHNFSGELIDGVLEEFTARFEQIGVKELSDRTMGAVSAFNPNMPFAEVAEMRSQLAELQPVIEGRLRLLTQIQRQFFLHPESGLGLHCREVAQQLTELHGKIRTVDSAIGDTDAAQIHSLIADIQQLQLSVLQVGETIRALAGRRG